MKPRHRLPLLALACIVFGLLFVPFLTSAAPSGGRLVNLLLTPTVWQYLPYVVRPVPPTATPTPPPTPTPGPHWVTIKAENFEGAFPNQWLVADLDDGSGEYFWGKRTCKAFAGQFGGWGVGAGANGSQLGCGSNYPDNAFSSMSYGLFSLADASDADLTYQLWLESEVNYDFFCSIAVINENDADGWCWSGDSDGWFFDELDLTDLPDLGDITGQPEVLIALLFASDGSISSGEGAHVDDILLRKFVGAQQASAELAPARPAAGSPTLARHSLHSLPAEVQGRIMAQLAQLR
ncbi:MAG: hypothetical protein ACRDHL_02790 [Candidatus Promineifilaceae bacterium]